MMMKHVGERRAVEIFLLQGWKSGQESAPRSISA